jgi:G:T/U-mismatch repair DNA glycosylase
MTLRYKTHPFNPLIQKGTKKLLVGTLPPESAPFYFSNSSNTRLWDILYAIEQKLPVVYKGGNDLSEKTKKGILKQLNLGITDIIYGYERVEGHFDSTRDKHIIPIEYKDLKKLVLKESIDEILFVYQSAYKWFVHSLTGDNPVRLYRIKDKYKIGYLESVKVADRSIKCVLLPSPLNRGQKGQNLAFKLDFYKKHILGKTEKSPA